VFDLLALLMYPRVILCPLLGTTLPASEASLYITKGTRRRPVPESCSYSLHLQLATSRRETKKKENKGWGVEGEKKSKKLTIPNINKTPHIIRLVRPREAHQALARVDRAAPRHLQRVARRVEPVLALCPRRVQRAQLVPYRVCFQAGWDRVVVTLVVGGGRGWYW
jgi:hypothetical protein